MKRFALLAACLCLPLLVQAAEYKPTVTSHRGASAYLPEHTLAAKAMAHAMGVDYIEQDVVMTKDGVLMVLHDPTLETTTDVARKFPGRHRADGHYYANDFTLEEIKSLRLSERFVPKTGKAVFADRFPVGFAIDFRVPTLEEEIIFIQGMNKSTGRDVGVYVEIKEPDFFEREGLPITQATIDLLTRYGYNREDANVILQIFDYPAVKKSRELGWKGPLAMLLTRNGQKMVDDKETHAYLQSPEGIRELARYATIYAPSFSLMYTPAEGGKGYTVTPIVQQARDAGMMIHTWTHRSDSLPKGFSSDDAVFDAMFKDMKVDGLFSDFPDRAVNYLRKNGIRR